jgi:hypothetical protein
MLTRLLGPILSNDALTRGLGDPEARILVEWLVAETEHVARDAACEETARRRVERLCQRGRALSRFVRLWCHEENASAAYQLAACERFPWPLPTVLMDPCDLMQDITTWESSAENQTLASSPSSMS